MEKRDDAELGALWEKEGRVGVYMTGTINGTAVVVFATNAKSSKAPTWRVLKATPKDERPASRRDDGDDF